MQGLQRLLTLTLPNKIIEHLPLVLWFVSYLLTTLHPQLLRACALRFPLVEIGAPQETSSLPSMRAPTMSLLHASESSLLESEQNNIIMKLWRILTLLPQRLFSKFANLIKTRWLNFVQPQLPLRLFNGMSSMSVMQATSNQSYSAWRCFAAAVFTCGASVFVHATKNNLIDTLWSYVTATFNLLSDENAISARYVHRRQLLVEYTCAFLCNVLMNMFFQSLFTGVDTQGKFWRHMPSASELQSAKQEYKHNLFYRLYGNLALMLYLLYVQVITLRNPWIGWFLRLRAPNNNNRTNQHNTNTTTPASLSSSSLPLSSQEIASHSNTVNLITSNNNNSYNNNREAQIINHSTPPSAVVYVSMNNMFVSALAGFRLVYRGDSSQLLRILQIHVYNTTQLAIYNLLDRWFGRSYQRRVLTELFFTQQPHQDNEAITLSPNNTELQTILPAATPSSSSSASLQENHTRTQLPSLTLRNVKDMIMLCGKRIQEFATSAIRIFLYGDVADVINNMYESQVASSSASASSFPLTTTSSEALPTQQIREREPAQTAQVRQEVNDRHCVETNLLVNLREYALSPTSSYTLIFFHLLHFLAGMMAGLLVRKLIAYWNNNSEKYEWLQPVISWLFPAPVHIPEILLRNANASDGLCRIYSDDPEVISIVQRLRKNNNTHNIQNHRGNINANAITTTTTTTTTTSSSSSSSAIVPLAERLRSSVNTSVSNEEALELPPPLLVAAGEVRQPVNTSNHEVIAEIPVSFDCFCPISLTIMTDPVSTVDGFTYERTEIEQWLSQQQTSPMTNLRLNDLTLTTNTEVRKKIEVIAQQCNTMLRELEHLLEKSFLSVLREPFLTLISLK